MAVWTFSWQEGTPGEDVARTVADRAGVPVVEREAVAAIAAALDMDAEEAGELERHLPGRFAELALHTAAGFGLTSCEALLELRRLPALRRATEAVIRGVARSPCVILGRAGFAVLREHPGAVHVRVEAPLEWRVRRCAREHLLTPERAREAVERGDCERASYVRRLYGLDVARAENYHVVCDASRLHVGRMADIALVAGGVALAAPAGSPVRG
jgi:hypothetical protein